MLWVANPTPRAGGMPNPFLAPPDLTLTTLTQTAVGRHGGISRNPEISGASDDRDQAAVSALKSQLAQLRSTRSSHHAELGSLSVWPDTATAETEAGDQRANIPAMNRVQSLLEAIEITYLPVSLANAICLDSGMVKAKGFEVALVQGGSAKLVDLDNWSLMNLGVKEVLSLVERLKQETGLSVSEIQSSVEPYAIQTIGLAEMHRSYLRDIQEFPVLIVAQTCVQVWLEAAALAGVGTRQILAINTLTDHSVNTDQLRDTMEDCVQKRRPILQLVGDNVPITAGAGDPLGQLLNLRNDYFAKGLAFPVKIDGLRIS
tara:strand:+ start:32227 stop:33177 length:951 start_codon:yes stop_codon:yes gene_type:complete